MCDHTSGEEGTPILYSGWTRVRFMLLMFATPLIGGHVTPKAEEGGEWSGSWHASRQD